MTSRQLVRAAYSNDLQDFSGPHRAILIQLLVFVQETNVKQLEGEVHGGARVGQEGKKAGHTDILDNLGGAAPKEVARRRLVNPRLHGGGGHDDCQTMISGLVHFGIQVLYPKRNVVQAGAHLTYGPRVAGLSFHGLDKLDGQSADPAECDTNDELFHGLPVPDDPIAGAFLVDGPGTNAEKAPPTFGKASMFCTANPTCERATIAKLLSLLLFTAPPS